MSLNYKTFHYDGPVMNPFNGELIDASWHGETTAISKDRAIETMELDWFHRIGIVVSLNKLFLKEIEL